MHSSWPLFSCMSYQIMQLNVFFHENPFFVYLQVEDNNVNIHPRLNLVTIKYPSRTWGNYFVSHIGTWEDAGGRFAPGYGAKWPICIGLKFCQYLSYVNAFGNKTQLK